VDAHEHDVDGGRRHEVRSLEAVQHGDREPRRDLQRCQGLAWRSDEALGSFALKHETSVVRRGRCARQPPDDLRREIERRAREDDVVDSRQRVRPDVPFSHRDVGAASEPRPQVTGERWILLHRDHPCRVSCEGCGEDAGTGAQVVDHIGGSDPAERDQALRQQRVAEEVLGAPQA
jgi:hypothetical protein